MALRGVGASVIRDARRGAGGGNLTSEVCVVGAGPVGLALGTSLAARGVRTLVLEAGALDLDIESQRLAAGEIGGRAYDELEHARARAFGGSSRLWNVDMGGGPGGARLRRLDPIDFAERYWVPGSGWPLRFEELVPFYEEAERFLGVEAPDPTFGGASGPLRRFEPSLEPTVFKLGTGASLLDLRDRIDDCDDLTVLVHAVLVGMGWDSGSGRIEQADVMTVTGNDYTIRSRYFVLAAGGIENARILLMTDLDGEGVGALGNQSGMVGRFFMEHPHTRAGFLVAQSEMHEDLVKAVTERDGVLGELWLRVGDDLAREKKLGNSAIAFSPVPMSEVRRVEAMGRTHPSVRAVRKAFSSLRRDKNAAAATRLAGTALKGGPHLVAAALRKLRWRVSERSSMGSDDGSGVMRVDVMSEQVPNLDSRVVLSSNVDPIGMPRARLEWRLSDADMQSLSRLSEVLANLFSDQQAGKLIVPFDPRSTPISWGFHHMGTTRMDDDPARGVVDRNSRVHQTTNLFAAGSSVFPTGGVSNPTLTAVALGFRLADHLGKLVASDS